MRLDLYVSEKFNVSRNKAQFSIQESKIKVNWKIITKSSFDVLEKDIIEIIDDLEIKYVARSALKLKWFIQENNLIINNFVCLDIWSSTWWFSQILLENNVSKIYAVDVWTSQLHEKIKSDKRVISIENTDIRNFIKNDIYDLIVCDVSFISLSLLIESIYNLAQEKTKILLLFKPQYEVGNQNLTKWWVPKDEKISINRLNKFLEDLRKSNFKINLVKKSILLWESWNQEYFIYCNKK